MISKASISRGFLELPLKRLCTLEAIIEYDQAAIRSLDPIRERFERGTVVASPTSERLLFIISGWTCTTLGLPNGRRQFLCLGLPGDPIGDLGSPLHPANSQTFALTPVEVIDATPLTARDQTGAFAYLSVIAALRAAQHRANGYVYDHVVRLGAHNALTRIGHLLLEIHDRLSEVGLTHNDRFLFPITQRQLGDTVSLSEVHVNRVLRYLKANGLLVDGPGWLALPSPSGLADLVGYPGYPSPPYEIHSSPQGLNN